MSVLLFSITESFGKSLARRTLVPALGPGTGQPRTHRVAREGLPLGVSRVKFGDGFSGRLDREPPAQSKAACLPPWPSAWGLFGMRKRNAAI